MSASFTRTIRPSSLVVWLDCPRRWAARHLAAEITGAGYSLQDARPAHVGAVVGSGVHGAAGWTMEQKRTTGELGNETEARERGLEAMRDAAQYGVTWDTVTGTLNTAQQQVLRMTYTYRRDLAPRLTPIVVEERVDGDLGDGWTLSGQVDMLAGDPRTGIDDLKTGTQQRANGVQYGSYALLWEMKGYQPAVIREHFIRRVAIMKPQPPAATTEMDIRTAQADALEAIDDIKRSTALFHDRLKRGGRPPPSAYRANPSSSLCGAKWCPAWGTNFCTVHKKD